eukprot:1376803-Amorphochlora_amoeboformis.AAC.1
MSHDDHGMYTLSTYAPDDEQLFPSIYRSRPISADILTPGGFCYVTRDVEHSLAALFDELKEGTRVFRVPANSRPRNDLKFAFERKEEKAGEVPYSQQGDPSADTPRTMEIRQRLIYHPNVQ